MRFDIVTIFPEFFDGPLDYGIVRRAREAGLVEVQVHDLREFTRDRHRTVDDRPFGGGEGMVLKPEPLFEAVEALLQTPGESGRAGEPARATTARRAAEEAGQPGVAVPTRTAIVLLSASGMLFRQEAARRYARLERVVLLCGRYEGVDERVAEHLATEEVAIGDFVLSGGELPAAIIVDAVTRLLPGALGNEASAVHESFSVADGSQPSANSRQSPVVNSQSSASRPNSQVFGTESPSSNLQPLTSGILDCPHYTRPAEFRGWPVPEVLMSGNHEQIRRWRRKMALSKTLRNRPDLLGGVAFSDEDRRLLDELRNDHET